MEPRYTITSKLLANIKTIGALTAELNTKPFSRVVLAEMEKRAREISAHASTSIEGNPLSFSEVKKLLKVHPNHPRSSEKEVLNYNEALLWLNEEVKRQAMVVNLPCILRIHRIVTKGIISPSRCGKIRQESVFVNDPIAQRIVYWPPDHDGVLQLMHELMDFIKKSVSTLDPLILAGLFHKKFVIIHPFMDGNGRTVRLATKALLARMGLNTFNLFSFENFYNQDVATYFRKVGVHGNYYDLKSHIDYTEWLEYFTEGIADELSRVGKVLQESFIRPESILQPHHRKLLEYIEKNGYVTDKIYATLTDRAKATRNQDFNKLIALGKIERVGKSKSTIYRFKA